MKNNTDKKTTAIELCLECNERPIHIKKRKLCSLCYGRLKRNERSTIPISEKHRFCDITEKKHQHTREIDFIKNYFNHSNWIHKPALFRFGNLKYSPDFYDGENNVFIEVSGTRQAYHANKDKYEAFQKAYPKINFEIRKPCGELLNTDSRDKNWQQ